MKNKKITSLFAFVCLICVVAGLAVTNAFAQTAEDLRQSGAAGERYDGLMEARDPEVLTLVESINAKRRKVYETRAKELGVPVDQVGQIYAKEILEDAKPGVWFKNSSGNWQQK